MPPDPLTPEPNETETPSPIEAGEKSSTGTPDAGAEAAAGASSPQAVDGAPEAPEAPAEQFLSIRDAAKEFGYAEAGNFSDDESALKHLIEQAQRTPSPTPVDEHLSQYGRRYVEHAADFEQYLRDRETQQQTAAAEQAKSEDPKFWNAPDWNPAWMQQVEVDPDSGQLRPTNGGSHETVARVQQYMQHRQDQQEQFWSDPFSYFEPFLQHREQQLEERVQDLVQNALGTERLQAQTHQFVNQNADWLYEKDAQGNSVFDPQTGHRNLTEDGQRFAGYAHALNKLPPDVQQEYAMRLLEADHIRSGRKTPETSRQEKNKQILMRNANFQANTGGSETQVTDPNAPPQNTEQDLEQMLRSSYRENGIDDAKLRETILSEY